MALKHRGIALAIVFVVLVGALVALGITLGSRIIDQASSLFSKLPDLIGHERLQSIPLPYWLEPLRERIVAALQAEAANPAAQYRSAAAAGRRAHSFWH